MPFSGWARFPLSGGFLVVSLLFLSSPGCGGKNQEQLQQEAHLTKLVRWYGQYLNAHKGKAPAGLEEFKGFMKKQGSKESGEDLDKLFVSPRDNKPYVIIFKIISNYSDPQNPPLIAYEQEGKGGRRYVAYLTTKVEEVDEGRFQELLKSGKSG